MLCAVRFYIGHLVLTELYFLLTVEGLKMKLQKREREVESKKQELVSADTLGARDFSSAVFGFCQFFIVNRAKSFSRGFAARGFGLRPTPKIPATRKKNLWHPG